MERITTTMTKQETKKTNEKEISEKINDLKKIHGKNFFYMAPEELIKITHKNK